MKIKDIYKHFDDIGCVSFSTINDEGYIDSRIAHFFAYDDEGLYFRTMEVKEFYRQLKKHNNVSACGMYPNTRVTHDEEGLPHFVPGYTVRISGDTRELTMDEVNEKAKTNEEFVVATFDIKKYPSTRIFVLYKAKGEVYDYDFEKENRDHKLLRECFSYGGENATPAGLSITDKCIACGKCKRNCTFDAIEEGRPYHIIKERCDECGTCYEVCPVNAINTRS